MLEILLLLKFILYTSHIRVEFNRVPVILISTLFCVLILALLDNLSDNKRLKAKLAFYTLMSIWMFANATYYNYFNNLTSVVIIKQVTQLKVVGESIKGVIDIGRLLLIVDIPIVIYLGKKLHENKSKLIRPNGNFLNTVVALVAALSILLSYSVAIAHEQFPSIAKQELFTYHAKDIYDNLKEKEESPVQEEKIENIVEERKIKQEHIEKEYEGIGKGRNLIVLQVEALQNFVIGTNYNGIEITPNLNKLIADNSSLYFNNYFQMIGRGNTSDAEFVSNNSIYPSMTQPTYLEYADNTFYGLPWLLRDHGYSVWAFHGFEKDFWNRSTAYPNQGYQRFISEEDFEFEDKIGFGISDEEFFKQSIPYLKELDDKNDNPFYAFMVTLSSHTPFNMPEELKVLGLDEELNNNIVGNYLEAIHYTDKQIGIFIEELKENGLYDNSVIAIYGDHQAILATNENEAKAMTNYLGREYGFDTMMNVPLIIHIPHMQLGQTKENMGSQLDFYPTIANIMGYNIEKGIVFGKDLLNDKSSNPVYTQTYMLLGSVITDEHVFVMSRDSIFDHSKAYDRKTGEEVDIQQFKKISQQGVEKIRLSNYILRNDLVRKYLQLETK